MLAVVTGTTLYLHGITIGFKTYNLVFTTIMVFGTLGYFYKEDLKRSLRAAITFGAMVVAHILIYLNLFRHGIGVSSARVGVTAILEFGVAGIILIVVGGEPSMAIVNDLLSSAMGNQCRMNCTTSGGRNGRWRKSASRGSTIAIRKPALIPRTSGCMLPARVDGSRRIRSWAIRSIRKHLTATRTRVVILPIGSIRLGFTLSSMEAVCMTRQISL